MSPINYVDSSGLGALASQGMYLGKKSKKLNLIGVKSGVGHLFKTSGFERILRLSGFKKGLFCFLNSLPLQKLFPND